MRCESVGDLGRRGLKRRLFTLSAFFSVSAYLLNRRERRDPLPHPAPVSLRLHALLISLALLLLLLGALAAPPGGWFRDGPGE